MRRLIIVGLGVASAALIAFGCGSSGGEATAQVSRAQFMKEAKAVCAKTQPKFVVAFHKSAGLADFSDRAAALLKQEAKGLEDLAGPEEVEAKFEPLIENMSKVSAAVAREGKKGLEDPAIPAYKQEAKELGLGAC